MPERWIANTCTACTHARLPRCAVVMSCCAVVGVAGVQAISNAKQLPGEDYHDSLVKLADMVLNRSS